MSNRQRRRTRPESPTKPSGRHKTRYYAQFPAGTQDLLLDALPTSLPEAAEVAYADDSAMVFDSLASADAVAEVPYFKNAFVVMASVPRTGLESGVIRLSKASTGCDFKTAQGSDRQFRIMFHIDGSLTSISPKARATLETAIAVSSGADLSRRGQCREYWVVGRSQMPDLLLCARLPKARKSDPVKGAVSPELSAMLIGASQPTPSDIFLDPFTGTGAFIAARLQHPVSKAIYSDVKLEEHRQRFPRSLRSDKRVLLLDEDALELPRIANGSVDAIVTDPPWGEYADVSSPYEEFGRRLATSFKRVLKLDSGRYVVMVSRRNAKTLASAFGASGLTVQAQHQILVNGHPATVLVGKLAG